MLCLQRRNKQIIRSRWNSNNRLLTISDPSYFRCSKTYKLSNNDHKKFGTSCSYEWVKNKQNCSLIVFSMNVRNQLNQVIHQSHIIKMKIPKVRNTLILIHLKMTKKNSFQTEKKKKTMKKTNITVTISDKKFSLNNKKRILNLKIMILMYKMRK